MGSISLEFGSLLGILYNQYRGIGGKSSCEFRNMKSDLLSLVLLDDRFRKISHPSHFVLKDTSG